MGGKSKLNLIQKRCAVASPIHDGLSFFSPPLFMLFFHLFSVICLEIS